MKKLVTITAIFVMFVVGCSNQENSITSPISTNVEQSSQVSLTGLIMTRVDETVLGVATVNKEIDGGVGGIISFDQDVINSRGEVVQVNANFAIPADAFSGAKNITMTVDVDNGCIYFFPHMNFSQECKLNLELRKMNLVDLGYTSDKDTTDFVYFPDSGPIVPILSSGVTLNFNEGKLKVYKAKIFHFSRYGFIRRY